MKKNRSKKGRSVRDAAKLSAEPPYPYSGRDISGFFSRHENVRVAYLKIERSIDDFGHHICEFILKGEGERLFVQGVEFQRNRFRYPPHLQAIPNHVKKTLEKQVIHRLLQTRVVESPLSDEALAYSGARVIPGTAPFHAYWVHARRYGFAARRCRGKRVLDAGCGSGYGTRILGREATECVGVDNDPEAVRLAESLFGAPDVRFAVADVSRLEGFDEETFDVVVALEVLEHLPTESIPAFMEAVLRVLTSDGTFVVSVANRAHHDKEENPFHLSEMLFSEFKERLEAGFPSSKVEFFGQDAWGGSWRLDKECTIEPIRSETSDHVYLAVVQSGRSG